MSSSICVSTCDTPGPDPVIIVGECGGFPVSSDLVTTAARRGHGDRTLTTCCSLRPDVPLSHYRATLRFQVLDEVQKIDTLISRSFLKMQEIYLFVP